MCDGRNNYLIISIHSHYLSPQTATYTCTKNKELWNAKAIHPILVQQNRVFWWCNIGCIGTPK